MLVLILTIFPVFLAGLMFILILRYFPGFLSFPLDLGLTINKKRIFGDNKTFRGPIVMGTSVALFGTFTATLLGYSQDYKFLLVSYFLIGLLYSIGELPNSFLKRQLNVAPGKAHEDKFYAKVFKVVDTYDSLLLCGVGYVYLFNFDFTYMLLSVLLGGLLHLVTDQWMRSLKLK